MENKGIKWEYLYVNAETRTVCSFKVKVELWCKNYLGLHHFMSIAALPSNMSSPWNYVI